MQFVGYFPGADFASESQYGRQTHVLKLIEHIGNREDVRSTFFVSNPAGYFSDMDVRVVESEQSLSGGFQSEISRIRDLLSIIRSSGDSTVVYCREAPDLAPTIATLLTDAALVVEANSAHEPPDKMTLKESITRTRHQSLRKFKWRTADHVIAVSESVARYLRETIGVDKVTVVENGVDVDLFSIERPVSTGPPYSICYVGGLQTWQNIELMIQVVTYLDTQVNLVVVGGTESEISQLESVASNYGVDDSVEFVGRVPHSDVPDYVNDADLCFGPFASVRKASPIKIYEYLACGREVVIVNDEGLEYLCLYPGVHRFPLADAEEIATKVDEVLATLETNQDGAKYVQEHRSWGSIADETLEICRKTQASLFATDSSHK